jgi:hypothetical protein
MKELLFFRSRAAVDALRIVSAILLIPALYFAVHYDFPPLHWGPPPEYELRKPLQDLSIKVSRSRYYDISVERLFEGQTLWKARISEADFMRLAAARSMVPFNTAEIDDSFRRKAPFWWTPRITAKTKAYATPGFSLSHDFRSEGWFAFATWDPSDQMIYMWIVYMA